MAKLILEFSSSSSPELLSVFFEHPMLSQSHFTLRGKSSAVHAAQGTFQWTSAVQALSVFLLRALAVYRHGDFSPCPSPVLEGEGSSLASALDYALAKQPVWLLDIFGTDKRGRSLARRLIKRCNPERKRKGPVQLSLNDKFLKPEEISIKLRHTLVVNAEYLDHLANVVTDAWESKYHPKLPGWRPCPGLKLLQAAGEENKLADTSNEKPKVIIAPDLLARILKREFCSMLSDSIWRNQERLKKKLRALDQTPTAAKLFLQLKPLAEQLSGPAETSLSAGFNWREVLQTLSGDASISCAVPWINASSLALFHYLKHFKGCNLEISYEYDYSIKLKRSLIRGTLTRLPDVCVLGIGPAASLASARRNNKYLARMFLPCISHRIVLPQEAVQLGQELSYGEYAFICEEPSTSVFYFEELNRRSLINPRQVAVTHLEPEYMPRALQQGNPDLRAIMFFPHYNLNEMFNNCRLIETPQESIDHQETVLFFSRSFAAQKKKAHCLEQALRFAWTELAQSAVLLDKVSKSMAADETFCSFLSSFTGLESMIRH